jgi:TIR domain-containing protein
MFPHPKEVFLSYSSLDWEFAHKIVDLLRRHGVPVWHGPSSIRGGQQWLDEIGDALERCDWFVILLSPNSMKSKWVRRELVFAFDEDRYDNSIVPVVIDADIYRKLSWPFRSYQFVDFTKDFEKGCRALLRIWGIGYQAINPDA